MSTGAGTRSLILPGGATAMPDSSVGQYETSSESLLFDLEIQGESYKEGSSYPWRGGTHAAVIEADSPAEAVIEVLEGLGNHGRRVEESGDTDWTVFDSEREMVIRVKPVPDATAGR